MLLAGFSFAQQDLPGKELHKNVHLVTNATKEKKEALWDLFIMPRCGTEAAPQSCTVKRNNFAMNGGRWK